MLREKIAELLHNRYRPATWPEWKDFENEHLKEQTRQFAGKILTAIAEAAEEGMQTKNPYPSDIFPMTIETASKYVPYDKRDAVFGAWGRYVWELATQEFVKLLKEE